MQKHRGGAGQGNFDNVQTEADVIPGWLSICLYFYPKMFLCGIVTKYLGLVGMVSLITLSVLDYRRLMPQGFKVSRVSRFLLIRGPSPHPQGSSVR